MLANFLYFRDFNPILSFSGSSYDPWRSYLSEQICANPEPLFDELLSALRTTMENPGLLYYNLTEAICMMPQP